MATSWSRPMSATSQANHGRPDRHPPSGLGMGNADQTVIDENRGVSFKGFENFALNLGSGADELTITAVDSHTATRVDAGGGDDLIKVGGTGTGKVGQYRRAARTDRRRAVRRRRGTCQQRAKFPHP